MCIFLSNLAFGRREKNIWGTLFCFRGAQKAVGGARKKVPDLFFFFFLGTQKILGGGGHFSSLSGGAPTGKVTPLLSYDIFDRIDVTVAHRSNYVNYMKDNPIIAKRKKVNLKGLI